MAFFCQPSRKDNAREKQRRYSNDITSEDNGESNYSSEEDEYTSDSDSDIGDAYLTSSLITRAKKRRRVDSFPMPKYDHRSSNSPLIKKGKHSEKQQRSYRLEDSVDSPEESSQSECRSTSFMNWKGTMSLPLSFSLSRSPSPCSESSDSSCTDSFTESESEEESQWSSSIKEKGRKQMQQHSSKHVVAFDCEMVSCKPTLEWLLRAPVKTGKRKRTPSEVSVAAHCAVVDYNYKVLYNSFIRSNLSVTNWRGIRHGDMVTAIPFEEAREQILSLLKCNLVVANDIRHDLASLQIRKVIDLPLCNIRDTSTCGILRRRANIPREHPHAKLQELAKGVLHCKVQKKKPHNPVEDAQVAMELYRNVEEEWEREVSRQYNSGTGSESSDDTL